MRRAVERMMANNKKSTFLLQLTAMVDMFTILIVFLLKSYSTSAVDIIPHEGLRLPASYSQAMPIEAIRLVVAIDGIYLEDKLVAKVAEGKIGESDLDDTDTEFIRPLFDELEKHAKKSQEIAQVNEEHKFEGKVVMQADSRLKYGLLKKVMYTSSMAGYADLRLATVVME